MNHPAILTENLRPTPAWLIAAMSAVIAWGVSTIITPGDWYASLHKPSWHLSAQEFSDGFAAVYLTMAVALLLLLRAEPSATRTQSLLVFSLQLVLSALWGPLFFGLQMPVVAVAHRDHPLHRLGRELSARDLREHRHVLVLDSGHVAWSGSGPEARANPAVLSAHF